MKNNLPPGLDCPECSHRIPLSIPMLVSGQPIYCGSCRLKLEVDNKKSAYVLDKLNVYHGKMRQADAMAKGAMGR